VADAAAAAPNVSDLNLDARLEAQLRFLVTVDALKHVERRTLTADGRRLENSAEHSWHVALYVRVLAEHSPEPIDVDRVILMALLHDIVEIDAGDTFLYDVAGRAGQVERERAAADRLFALLPLDQSTLLRAIWDEFCAAESPEARLANAIDRLQPILHNFLTAGERWLAHGISVDQVRTLNLPVTDDVPPLGDVVRRIIAHAAAAGWLADGDAPER
jgi:putative hydrolase of HD superfamily